MYFFIQTVPSCAVPVTEDRCLPPPSVASSDCSADTDTEPPSNRSTLKRGAACPYDAAGTGDEDDEGSVESGRSTLTREAAPPALGMLSSERVLQQLEEAWRREEVTPVTNVTPVTSVTPARTAPSEVCPAGDGQKRFTYVVDREFGVEV